MDRIIPNRRLGIVFHLAVSLMIIFSLSRSLVSDTGFIYSSKILLFCLSYVLTLLFFSLFSENVTTKTIIILLALFCSYELYTGISQLLGFSVSNNVRFAITGSFTNPGPYGGFISVSLILLLAYCVKNHEGRKKNHISNLVYSGVFVVAVVAMMVLPSTQSRSSILALVCGIILVAIGEERIKEKTIPFFRKYGVWLVLILLFIGTGAYLFKKPSADGRFYMGRICVKAICENGWKGAGVEHFGEAYGQTQAHYFKQQIDENGKDDLDWRAIDEHTRMVADCPDSAFNEYLSIGVEEGPIVMLLFIAVIVTAFVISFRRGTIWCYGLTTLAVFAFFSYPFHLWQFQIMLSFLLAACVSDGDNKDVKKKILRLSILSTSLVVLCFVTYYKVIPGLRQYRKAEQAWKKAERLYNKEYYEYVDEYCDTIVPFFKYDEHFLFAYGQSLNKSGNYNKSDSILMMGASISCDPMFWNVMGNNSLALGKYREAEERYKHAFYMVPNRLYPLYLLAKLYHTEGDTVKFMDMADRVDSFIPKVESRNTSRLRDEINEIKIGYIQ
jgi:tetratricopeptide (TPR) repeat protein